MKPNQASESNQHCLKGQVFFQSCCLNATDASSNTPQLNIKKPRIFIKLSKNLPHSKGKAKPIQVHHHHRAAEPPIHQHQYGYDQDKLSFLDQIRKYNPNPQAEKQEQPTFTFDSSLNSSSKVGQNNLSFILDNLNNEMFSDMFVSESVKEKIVVSGSLGCITEVKSDMEISQRQDTLFTSTHHNDRL